MAKTKEEKILEYDKKIEELQNKKKELDAKINEYAEKREKLQLAMANEKLNNILALGLSLEELTKLATEEAKKKASVSDNKTITE